MHFSKLCADLGIPWGEVARILGIEQHLVDAIDGGKAWLADRGSLENAAQRLQAAARRLQARANRPADEDVVVNENDALRAIEDDQGDNEHKPLPAEVADWERAANEELEANVRPRAGVSRRRRGRFDRPNEERATIDCRTIEKYVRKGACVHPGIWAVGKIRFVGYSVKVLPPPPP